VRRNAVAQAGTLSRTARRGGRRRPGIEPVHETRTGRAPTPSRSG
jgi:hypothetical protein